eukprot:9576419-Alexandrium_andersonii.AAC.1
MPKQTYVGTIPKNNSNMFGSLLRGALVTRTADRKYDWIAAAWSVCYTDRQPQQNKIALRRRTQLATMGRPCLNGASRSGQGIWRSGDRAQMFLMAV